MDGQTHSSRYAAIAGYNQLFSYADAYRNASAVMCQKMMSHTISRTWPNAVVVLMLAAHATELFLKSALLTRDSATNVWDYYHGVDDFSAEYELQFPEPQFKWEIPFTSGFSEAERLAWVTDLQPCLTDVKLKELRLATPAPSTLYRYPTDNEGRVWHALYGFKPQSCLLLLSQVESDFDRIISHLDLDTSPQSA